MITVAAATTTTATNTWHWFMSASQVELK